MEDFINKLKEEISKEPVWASLQVIEIIDELAEPQAGQPCDGCEYSKPYIEYKCTHHSCKYEDEPSNEKRTE